MRSDKNCPVCYSNLLVSVFRNNSIPIYNLQYCKSSKKAQNIKKVSVNFNLCKNCGFLFNKIYKQLNYRINYNSNRSYSLIYKTYLNKIFLILKKKIKIKNLQNILEIGFGDGKFIKKFIKYKKKIFGFDPAYKNKIITGYKGIRLSNKIYDNKNFVNPNILILRHVIEHIKSPNLFFKKILHEKPEYLFLEFPCSDFVLNDNFHYFSNEHCSYFNKKSISIILNKFGYQIILTQKVFNKENLVVVAIKSNINKIDKEYKVYNYKKKSFENYEKKFFNFKHKIIKKINFLRKDIIWGASGKGVMLLNILNLNRKVMPYIVDLNEEIENTFIPVSSNKIISPKYLSKILTNNSVIFILNKLYKKEIENILKKLKLKNKVLNLI